MSSVFFRILSTFFIVLWFFSSIPSAIDLTLIGHVHHWTNIKYPNWFRYAIPTFRRNSDYNLLNDNNTHPQVILQLSIDFIIVLVSSALFILFYTNDIFLKIFTIIIGQIWIVKYYGLHLLAKVEYKKFKKGLIKRNEN